MDATEKNEDGGTKWWQKVNWNVVLVVSLLSLSVMLLVMSLMTYFSQGPSVVNKRAVIGTEETGTRLTHSKDLVCVFNFREAAQDGMSLADVPFAFCTQVVICCILHENSARENDVLNAGGLALAHHMDAVVYLGFRVNDIESSWIKPAFLNGLGAQHVVTIMADLLRRHSAYKGLFLNIQDYRNVSKSNLLVFMRVLAEVLFSMGGKFLVTLPTDDRTQSEYFSRSLTEVPSVMFVKVSHFLPPTELKDKKVVCGTPYDNNNKRSLLGAIESIKGWDNSSGINVAPRTYFTLDVASYQYTVKEEYPFPLQKRQRIAYRQLCDICAIHHPGTVWKTYEDYETRCEVAATEQAVMTASNPKLISRIATYFAANYAGVVIFNIHLDDFTGLCGRRFTMIRRAYCALEYISVENCTQIQVY